MKKISVTSSLFLFGLLLALCAAFNFDLISSNLGLSRFNLGSLKEFVFGHLADGSESGANTADDSQSGDPRAALVAPSLDESNFANGDASHGSKSGTKSISAGEPTVEMVYSSQTSNRERIEILGTAVASGSLRAFQYLRTEFTETVPEYRTEILPILKQRADESLLKRFAEDDWKDWLDSGTVLGGKPTAAFMYGTDLYLVNHELGRFVFTSGYLFHRAWAAASKGELLIPREELTKLMRDRGRLRREVATGINWRDLIEPGLADDPVITKFLALIRYRLIEKALAPDANNNVRAVNLLLSLPHSMQAAAKADQTSQTSAQLPASTVRTIASFLRRISADEDSAARNTIVQAEHETLTLSHLAGQHSSLKSPIAYLLLAVALDMHERGEREDASTAAHFARQFDPTILTDDEMVLFTGEKVNSAASGSGSVRATASGALSRLVSGAGLISKTDPLPLATGNGAVINSGEVAQVEDSPAGELAASLDSHDQTLRLNNGQGTEGSRFRLDSGSTSKTVAVAATANPAPTVPFGMIILGGLILLGLVFGFRYALNKFQNRFGEAEFSNLTSGGQQANGDFTIGEGLNVLQGNHPPR